MELKGWPMLPWSPVDCQNLLDEVTAKWTKGICDIMEPLIPEPMPRKKEPRTVKKTRFSVAKKSLAYLKNATNRWAVHEEAFNGLAKALTRAQTHVAEAGIALPVEIRMDHNTTVDELRVAAGLFHTKASMALHRRLHRRVCGCILARVRLRKVEYFVGLETGKAKPFLRRSTSDGIEPLQVTQARVDGCLTTDPEKIRVAYAKKLTEWHRSRRSGPPCNDVTNVEALYEKRLLKELDGFF